MEWNERRLSRHLNLRDLNVLLTVARCGSMGKAAAELSVSQPAISKAIADIEYALGVRLLDRSQRGVAPTVYGSALLAGGLNAFDELKQAIKRIEFLADPAAGEIRIGASVVIGASLVAEVVDRLSRKYPRIKVHLLAGEAAMIYRALEEREVEVVIAGIFGPVAEDHMIAELLYDDAFVIAAGAENSWCRRRRIRLSDLMNEPWTLPPPDSLTGAIVVEIFRTHGLELPRATLVTSSIPARCALLASGRFLTMVPISVLRLGGRKQQIKALPVDIPTVGRPIGIVTLKNRTLSPVAQLFIAAAREFRDPILGRAPGHKAEARA
ncbi:MAG TPA: LysR family transcriptional regulator [Xanthobacteraceae bacterium]|nr:LysR family transcriptional regulator [Xanthobacteraceae bacterium]